MDRDKRYREAHREERRLYMIEYRRVRKALAAVEAHRMAHHALIERLLNKFWRTK